MATKCIDCNPDYTAYPTDAIYFIEDIPSIGVKAGDTLQKGFNALLKAVPSFSNTTGEVTGAEVSVGAPPQYLVSGYSSYWSKISLSNGWYMVDSAGNDRVVSYDFSDVLANLGTAVSHVSTAVEVYYTEKGAVKKYTTSSGSANSFRFEMSLFPVNISIKVELKAAADASAIFLTKDISLGNIPQAKSLFKFEIKGFEKFTEYSLEDVNQLIYAKIANMSNYLDDLRSRDIVANMAVMKANVDTLVSSSKEEAVFEIGRQRITLTQFITDMYAKMDELVKKIEKYESA